MRHARSILCMTSWFSKNLRFRPSIRIRKAGFFKNLHSGERFSKDPFSVTAFTGYVRTVGQTEEKKNTRLIVWTVP